jgi:hypothetical protein
MPKNASPSDGHKVYAQTHKHFVRASG